MFDMSWQDAIFMFGNFAFFVALIPSITSVHKPSKWTSFMTASVLTVYVFTYYSLGLTFGTITGTLTALAWWILFFQKWRL